MLNLIERIKNRSKPYKTKYECFVNGKKVEIKYSREGKKTIEFKKFNFSTGDSAKIIITNLVTNEVDEIKFLV